MTCLGWSWCDSEHYMNMLRICSLFEVNVKLLTKKKPLNRMLTCGASRKVIFVDSKQIKIQAMTIPHIQSPK